MDHLLGVVWMIRMIGTAIEQGKYEGELRIYCHEDLKRIPTQPKQIAFTLKTKEGIRLTCAGDEPYNEKDEEFIKGSDWLMHEAFCLYAQRDIFKPYEKHHSTAKDACITARELEVPNLILYHTEDRNLADRKRLYTEEGREYYSGNLFVPEDLETFEI